MAKRVTSKKGGGGVHPPVFIVYGALSPARFVIIGGFECSYCHDHDIVKCTTGGFFFELP